MSSQSAEFDAFASDYDAALQRGLRFTGENKDYFAAGRMNWLQGRLEELREKPESILDFGCGTGSAVPWIRNILGVRRIVGSDVSKESLEKARLRFADPETSFVSCGEEPADELDLAFCNGVFHHIEPEIRRNAVQQVAQALKPNGVFAFWENNPWNPGTRWMMSKIPFDADAVLVWPSEAKQLLRNAGFEILLTDFLFYFPQPLAFLRPIEPYLSKLPLGGQYLVLARKRA